MANSHTTVEKPATKKKLRSYGIFNKIPLAVPLLAGIIGGTTYYKYIEATRIVPMERRLKAYEMQDNDEMRLVSSSIRRRLRLRGEVELRFDTLGKVVYHDERMAITKEIEPTKLTNWQQLHLVKLNMMQNKTKAYEEKLNDTKKNVFAAAVGNCFWITVACESIMLIFRFLRRKLAKTEIKTDPKKPKKDLPEAEGKDEPAEKRERLDKRIMRRIRRTLGRLKSKEEEGLKTDAQGSPERIAQIIKDGASTGQIEGIETTEDEKTVGKPGEETAADQVEVRYVWSPVVTKPTPPVRDMIETTIDQMIAKFGKLTPVKKNILDMKLDSVREFVRAYLDYLVQPAGVRGIFAQNIVPGGFEEKWKAVGTEGFGAWKVFSKRVNGTGRIVIAINPAEETIGIYDIETDHGKYSSRLANFRPERVKSVKISCSD